MLDGSRTGGNSMKKSLFFNTDIQMPDEGDTPMNKEKAKEIPPEFEDKNLGKEASNSGSESVSACSDDSPKKAQATAPSHEDVITKLEANILYGKSKNVKDDAKELLKTEAEVISQLNKIKNYDL